MQIFQSKKDSVSKAKRKFMAEGGLHLYSGGATVLRPCDLYRYGKDKRFREAIEGCNIYIVARRRRISINPHSLRIVDGLVYGDFRLHGEDIFSYDEFPFSQKFPLVSPDGTPLRSEQVIAPNDFGFDIRVADSQHGVVNIPAHVLIANANHKLGRSTHLEVLYIGQGFGKDGKRLATDRLLAHTTLQRVLAESVEENPCDEVLLLLFRFEHARNVASTAGDFSVEPTATEEEEHEHLMRVGGLRFDRKTRVTLAEAALINYFKPKYNVMHKDSFSADRTKKLKTLQKLFSQDLTALMVEINTSNFGSQLYTTNAPAATIEKFFSSEHLNNWQSPQWLQNAGITKEEINGLVKDMTHAHIARFPLYTSSERETFLHSLPWSES